MTLRRILTVALAASGMMAGTAPDLRAQRPPLVAAASSLNPVLEEIAAAFTDETGLRVEIVFGASGTLTRQMQSGAPFEMFLSADEAYVERLHAAGLTRDAGAVYAVGRLVLFAPRGSPLDPTAGLEAIGALLDATQVRRFAIANPDLAPYGRAAEAALRATNLWDRIHPLLVFGENVSQTAQFAASGNTAGGLIPLSLALTPALAARGTYALVSDALHPPLRQRMVLVRDASGTVTRFYAFLQESTARGILERHGFEVMLLESPGV